MSDPEQDLRRYYAALQDPPTADLEARVMRAVTAVRPPVRSGRRLAILAASLVVAAAVGWAVYPPPTAPKPAQEPKPEEIAARVNGEVILWKDVAERFKDIKPSDVTDELRKSALRQHAETMIFRQFAVRKKLTVSDAEVDEAVQKDIKTFGGREEYEKVVRIRHGTAAKARESRREELLIFKAYRYVLVSAQTDPELQGLGLATDLVPEAELRKYYDANPKAFEAVEQISFVRIGLRFAGEREEEAQRALLESIRRKYEIGSDFSMLTYFTSEVRGAKGMFQRGVTRKELQGIYAPETVRFLMEELKEGEVSSILKDGATLNLFKMEQKINQRAETFEDAQSRIRAMLEYQIRENNRKKIRDLLRRNARFDPPDLFEEK